MQVEGWRYEKVGIECGHCAGHPFVLTCDNVSGSGHEWALAIICPSCRTVDWLEGCKDCAETIPASELPW